MERLRGAGAVPGFVVSTPAASAPAEALEGAAVLVVTDVGASDQDIFRIRTFVTAVRAAKPGIRILIAGAAVPSTTAAALAFAIARYGAREPVLRTISQRPRLMAIDRAIGEKGWKIAICRITCMV